MKTVWLVHYIEWDFCEAIGIANTATNANELLENNFKEHRKTRKRACYHTVETKVYTGAIHASR